MDLPHFSSICIAGDAGPGEAGGVDAPNGGDGCAVRRVRGWSGSRAAGRPSGRVRGRPGRCPGPVRVPQPQCILPALPRARARLMKARALSVPWLCCSGPRPDRMMAVAASPRMCAACSRARAGMPVARSVRSGHQAFTRRRTRSKPSVRWAMSASSIRRSRMAMCRRPLASAVSLPGDGLEVEGGGFGGEGAAGVADDELAAAGLLGVEPLHEGGHGLGGVGADEEDGLGAGDVLQGEGEAAVHAEGAQAGGGPGGHAEAGRYSRCAGFRGRCGRTCRACRPSRW